MAKGGYKREIKVDKHSLPTVWDLMNMHLLHGKGVAFTSFMMVMRPLSLFPKSYYHYTR
jgi:hypothetical protein